MKNLIKSCYIDSNVLIYSQDKDSAYFTQSIKALKFLVAENYQVFISSLVIDEFLYVAGFYLKKRLGKQDKVYLMLKKVLNNVLSFPNLKLINPPAVKNKQKALVDIMQKFNLAPRDAYHLLIMKENKISYFLTFDSDFDKVFAERVIHKLIF